jgi:hypothetical protein
LDAFERKKLTIALILKVKYQVRKVKNRKIPKRTRKMVIAGDVSRWTSFIVGVDGADRTVTIELEVEATDFNVFSFWQVQDQIWILE